MIKKIKIPIYFGRLVLIQEKSLKNIPKKYLPEDFDINGIEAFADCRMKKNGYREYVLVFIKPLNTREIVHEAFHALCMIFKHRDIYFSYDEHEHAAYMLGWIIEQCIKYLKIDNK